MQEIKVESLSGVRKKITLSVDSKTVDDKVTMFFNDVGKNIQVNGFRKGKVPMGVLKSRFVDQSRAAIAQSLLTEALTEAVKQHNLNTVGRPVIEGFNNNSKYPGQFGQDNSFSANILVDVLPTIDPVDYVGLELDNPANIDMDKSVESKLTEYRDQFAERRQVNDRPVQLRDSLVIDFKGFVEGNQFDGGTATGFLIDELGAENFIPGFEEQLVGMTLGSEKVINVRFPDNYGAQHLAGKDAEFNVTVHSIVEIKRAEVNSDLAMMVGFDSVDAMMSGIKKQVELEFAKQNRGKLEFEIAQKLLKTNAFDVPDALVDEELGRILNHISGGKANQIQKEVKDSLRNTAKLNVQKALLFDAIYNKENELEVGPDELDALLQEHADKNNKTKDELVSLLYNTNQMDSFMAILKGNKVVDFIVKSAKLKESELNK